MTLRIPTVSNALAENGINTFDVLTSIKENKPHETTIKEVFKQINDLDGVSEVKVVDMSLPRKVFMREYDAFKSDPQAYTATNDENEYQFARANNLQLMRKARR